MNKLLIIAGGTGGHIFPALVVAETLKKQGVLIEWLGTETGMEKKLVANRFPIYFLPVKAIRGKSFLTKILSPFRLVRAIFLAHGMIKKINPDCVLGMGGYASGPGGIATWLLRKKLVIHEQNAKAGLTNRLLSHFATTVLQAFPNAFSKKVAAITVGNPVRESIFAIHHADYYRAKNRALRILILGGSQGATAINKLMTQWISYCENPESFLLWHQTGKKDFELTKKNYLHYTASIYRIDSFIEKMDEAYRWADIVICRAGALTVSEIAAAELPGILIPYPYAADDHQFANAQFLEHAAAAKLFRESILTTHLLNDCLQNLLFSTEQLHLMSEKARICAQPDATSKIIAELSK
ncbi:MAG TPA: undecaprenyldiphospho-muramoylpentapeptide beta-N-acetylglucosaminyltransferase [Coxiellaceae bacterium]|nr:MAG: undecaprenyldiphospho-muramoylpentapeptide beta-N-acetylglucosaminyltransferase [Gammaproteobacteria bacterium RIFCSPHIGHO2_12_FULL_36_30]HLB56137.1 undecaprenyldiphospho-muramoylpentapeptide beta-N-acetylglucosaminyltransferase [Coxiellaceae bacterium]